MAGHPGAPTNGGRPTWFKRMMTTLFNCWRFVWPGSNSRLNTCSSPKRPHHGRPDGRWFVIGGKARTRTCPWTGSFRKRLEISYQSQLCLSLKSDLSGSSVEPPTTPDVQAVFCIDVRSEVFRRALEGCSDSIQTLGFAGFFGLPISYSPLGTSGQRPQLPGLLAPKLCVTDTTGSEETDQLSITKRRQSLGLKSVWKDFRSSATSTFTFVESFGLFYAGSLLKRTVNKRNPKVEAGIAGHEGHSSPRLCFTHQDGGDAPTVESLVELVAGILRNMSLTSGFARIVLLTGHGSQTANNPHAAGLDCGACGGQTGEVNARVLAGLLNDPTIRFGLRTLGIEIPRYHSCPPRTAQHDNGRDHDL